MTESVVACKELVAAVARERYGDRLPRELRNQKSRKLRGIRERLVIDLAHPRYDVQHIACGEDQLGVLCAEMPGDLQRMRRLVEFLLFESDRERSCRQRAALLHV